MLAVSILTFARLLCTNCALVSGAPQLLLHDESRTAVDCVAAVDAWEVCYVRSLLCPASSNACLPSNVAVQCMHRYHNCSVLHQLGMVALRPVPVPARIAGWGILRPAGCLKCASSAACHSVTPPVLLFLLRCAPCCYWFAGPGLNRRQADCTIVCFYVSGLYKCCASRWQDVLSSQHPLMDRNSLTPGAFMVWSLLRSMPSMY